MEGEEDLKYRVCICGWISEAYPNNCMFIGPGGEAICPDCFKARRKNGALEGWGRVETINEKTYWRIIAARNRRAEILKYFHEEHEKVLIVRKMVREIKRIDKWKHREGEHRVKKAFPKRKKA
jgi:hypothetical protein